MKMCGISRFILTHDTFRPGTRSSEKKPRRRGTSADHNSAKCKTHCATCVAFCATSISRPSTAKFFPCVNHSFTCARRPYVKFDTPCPSEKQQRYEKERLSRVRAFIHFLFLTHAPSQNRIVYITTSAFGKVRPCSRNIVACIA